MFDFSWSELLVIGVVALVFIGPKELPGVLRTLGQWMTKIRRMAGEFQNQFHDAIREAELADLKKEVEQMGVHPSEYALDPLADVRKDMENAQRDIESAVAGKPAEQSAIAGAATEPAAEKSAEPPPASADEPAKEAAAPPTVVGSGPA